LTHSAGIVGDPAFFPDGKRIVYVNNSENDQNGTIEMIPLLGEPRVLIRGGPLYNKAPILSPDGRQLAYFEQRQGKWQLMTAPSNGGSPRELSYWTRSTRRREWGG
jgi:Tol biopolymer transport system component